MAKDITRQCDFFQKKLLSYNTFTLDDEVRADTFTGDTSFQYKVANLPENCIIQNAYFWVKVVDVTNDAVDVGTTAGGAEILADAGLDDLGVITPGTPVVSDTGTGVPVYVNFIADPIGDWTLVIEYLEYSVATGSFTKITN